MSNESGGLGGGAGDRLTALLALYNEHNIDARWQEECREKSSSAIIAANSVIVGIIAALGLQFSCIIFCVVQYLLASTGQRFILKYHALSERRHAYVSELQRKICETSGQADLETAFAAIRENKEARVKANSKLWRKLLDADKHTSIHELWHSLHSAFKIISFLLAAIIIVLDLQQGRPDSVLFQIWDSAASLLASFGLTRG